MNGRGGTLSMKCGSGWKLIGCVTSWSINVKADKLVEAKELLDLREQLRSIDDPEGYGITVAFVQGNQDKATHGASCFGHTRSNDPVISGNFKILGSILDALKADVDARLIALGVEL